MSTFHKSVLYQEVLEGLNVRPGEAYIDATLGGGGHSQGILERGGRVLGIDQDPQALEFVKKHIKSEDLILEEGNFADIDKIAADRGLLEISGIVFDLGVSSYQLNQVSRGFSFRNSAALDMRMSPKLAVTAADLVNGLTDKELYELFYRFGEERNARRIARAIVRSRSKDPIKKTDQLAALIEATVGRGQKIHPATRVFLALRAAVNSELRNLREALPKSENLLKTNGRLIVISFHSLEDRLVKNFIKESKNLVEVNKKPVVPSEEEIMENPRARSAKMRVAEKV
ncbi:MAG: 16S rRNA (cytosine(1402)-N(4))-methyltransferase RsmH [Candidatus Woykebacteria bacterium]